MAGTFGGSSQITAIEAEGLCAVRTLGLYDAAHKPSSQVVC